MKNFRYNGTEVIAFTLGSKQEVIMTPGWQGELPQENAYIRTLEATGVISVVGDPGQEKVDQDQGNTPGPGPDQDQVNVPGQSTGDQAPDNQPGKTSKSIKHHKPKTTNK